MASTKYNIGDIINLSFKIEHISIDEFGIHYRLEPVCELNGNNSVCDVNIVRFDHKLSIKFLE